MNYFFYIQLLSNYLISWFYGDLCVMYSCLPNERINSALYRNNMLTFVHLPAEAAEHVYVNIPNT